MGLLCSLFTEGVPPIGRGRTADGGGKDLGKIALIGESALQRHNADGLLGVLQKLSGDGHAAVGEIFTQRHAAIFAEKIHKGRFTAMKGGAEMGDGQLFADVAVDVADDRLSQVASGYRNGGKGGHVLGTKSHNVGKGGGRFIGQSRKALQMLGQLLGIGGVRKGGAENLLFAFVGYVTPLSHHEITYQNTTAIERTSGFPKTEAAFIEKDLAGMTYSLEGIAVGEKAMKACLGILLKHFAKAR